MFKEILLEEAASLQDLSGERRQGTVCWESPSNIAIVKYWGKHPGQLPANASLSMTLSKARTITSIRYETGVTHHGPELSFTFEKRPSAEFESRIKKNLDALAEYLPWLKTTKLQVDSKNTFPHSSGIASSASAMSAMAMCLLDIETELTQRPHTPQLLKKASYLARLGSGSASRSVYPGMAVWGRTAAWEDASDEYAIPVERLHPAFAGARDSILIIESGKKTVSSSLGHALMESNPYAPARFRQAEQHMQQLREILEHGNWNEFIDLAEREALTLHAMMLTGKPGYILMQPNTIAALNRIRDYRKQTGIPVGFTLDAGANVHVLYPESADQAVKNLIRHELAPLCENLEVIHDTIGNGPEKLEKDGSE